MAKIPMLQCSGCGAMTPVAGKVCHHCGRDKSYDQAVYNRIAGISSAAAVSGVLGGWLAWEAARFNAALITFLVIVCVVALAGFILVPKPKKQESRPPEVTISNSAQIAQQLSRAQPPAALNPAAVDKLRQLYELHLTGALTEQEFEAAKRRLMGL